MNNLEKIYRKAAIDEATKITTDVAIQFGKFISGVMPEKAKQVQRENYPDYMEKLFQLFMEKYYEQP
jgi:DNA repair photolyase